MEISENNPWISPIYNTELESMGSMHIPPRIMHIRNRQDGTQPENIVPPVSDAYVRQIRLSFIS